MEDLNAYENLAFGSGETPDVASSLLDMAAISPEVEDRDPVRGSPGEDNQGFVAGPAKEQSSTDDPETLMADHVFGSANPPSYQQDGGASGATACAEVLPAKLQISDHDCADPLPPPYNYGFLPSGNFPNSGSDFSQAPAYSHDATNQAALPHPQVFFLPQTGQSDHFSAVVFTQSPTMGVQPTVIPLPNNRSYQSFACPIILSCFALWFCGILFGLAAFIVASKSPVYSM